MHARVPSTPDHEWQGIKGAQGVKTWAQHCTLWRLFRTLFRTRLLRTLLRTRTSASTFLPLPALQSAPDARHVVNRAETPLDDDLAKLFGYSGLDQMLRSVPDAVRIDGDRLVGTRPATRHEVQAWVITGGSELSGATYIIDEAGGITPVKMGGAGAPKMQPVSALLSAHLPYDESVVYEDLTEMRKIHLASLLFNVEHRFLSEKVYSYIGNMLLAINPYRTLTMLIPGQRDPCAYYDAPVRAYYARLRGETRQQGVRAHVFVVADMAYRALGSEGINQSVVISGESGAGKTKSAREILRYIVEVASGAFDTGRSRGDADAIVNKITMNNPILEAFGNAKTLRNDNSSRFGECPTATFSGFLETQRPEER